MRLTVVPRRLPPGPGGTLGWMLRQELPGGRARLLRETGWFWSRATAEDFIVWLGTIGPESRRRYGVETNP